MFNSHHVSSYSYDYSVEVKRVLHRLLAKQKCDTRQVTRLLRQFQEGKLLKVDGLSLQQK